MNFLYVEKRFKALIWTTSIKPILLKEMLIFWICICFFFSIWVCWKSWKEVLELEQQLYKPLTLTLLPNFTSSPSFILISWGDQKVVLELEQWLYEAPVLALISKSISSPSSIWISWGRGQKVASKLEQQLYEPPALVFLPKSAWFLVK